MTYYRVTMRYIFSLLCFILLFYTTFSNNYSNTLKGKSKQYTGVSYQNIDINFGDSKEKCIELFKNEKIKIDSSQITESNDTIVFVEKVKIYDLELKNCRFEFGKNGLHTLVYSMTIKDLVDSNVIKVKYDNLFINLKKYYKTYEEVNQITNSYGEEGCFTNRTNIFEFGNKTKEVDLIIQPEKGNIHNFNFLKLYQHYNFPEK